jgi:hypothetical protein
MGGYQLCAGSGTRAAPAAAQAWHAGRSEYLSRVFGRPGPAPSAKPLIYRSTGRRGNHGAVQVYGNVKVIKYETRVEPSGDGLLHEIHQSMVDLWHRGFALPIRWTLASFSEPAAVVNGATSDRGDEIMTSVSDGADLEIGFPLPAYLVATDADGHSRTGLMPRGDERVHQH